LPGSARLGAAQEIEGGFVQAAGPVFRVGAQPRGSLEGAGRRSGSPPQPGVDGLAFECLSRPLVVAERGRGQMPRLPVRLAPAIEGLGQKTVG
jgi:hypothetical protein